MLPPNEITISEKTSEELEQPELKLWGFMADLGGPGWRIWDKEMTNSVGSIGPIKDINGNDAYIPYYIEGHYGMAPGKNPIYPIYVEA